MADTPLLELDQVDKSFGGLRVIADLDLVVKEHEIVSVIGPNGAGKTTLFNLITGLYHPDSGEIRLEGRNLVGLQPHVITEPRNRADVPDAAALPEHDRQGERDGRAVRPHEGRRPALDGQDSRGAARGEARSIGGRRRSSRSSATA